MANREDVDTLISAISLFKELKPEEKERTLGIMQGMLIAKGKNLKELFPPSINIIQHI